MKPDWKDAPAWANWLAQDKDGEWCWYQKMPVIRGKEWGYGMEIGYIDHAAWGDVVIDWNNSKEQRPMPYDAIDFETTRTTKGD